MNELMGKSKTDDQQKMKERQMRNEMMRGKKEEVQEAGADSLGSTHTWTSPLSLQRGLDTAGLRRQ